jgi:hypothetical protein
VEPELVVSHEDVTTLLGMIGDMKADVAAIKDLLSEDDGEEEEEEEGPDDDS